MECYSLTRILSPDENLKILLKNSITDELEELKKHPNDDTYCFGARLIMQIRKTNNFCESKGQHRAQKAKFMKFSNSLMCGAKGQLISE